MAPLIGDWCIHLGAHKTATTHVQATLAAAAPDLRGDGIAVLPCHVVRPILRDLGSWRATHRLLGRGAVAHRIEVRLASLAAEGCEAHGFCVALSDENVLGPLDRRHAAQALPAARAAARALGGDGAGPPDDAVSLDPQL